MAYDEVESITPRPKARPASAVVPKEPSFFDNFMDSITGPPTAQTEAAAAAIAAGVGNDNNSSAQVPEEPTPGELGPRLSNPARQYREALANRYSNAPPSIAPNMMSNALNTYESQLGAGPMPYQMMPYGLGSFQPQMQPGQYVSPAFQYAAQNYDRLGGAQRLMPRSMPMLSMAERQKVNDMARNMAEQEANRAAEKKALSEFRYMNDAFSGNFGGKGAGENKKQDIRQQLAPLLASFQKFGF